MDQSNKAANLQAQIFQLQNDIEALARLKQLLPGCKLYIHIEFYHTAESVKIEPEKNTPALFELFKTSNSLLTKTIDCGQRQIENLQTQLNELL